MQLGNKQCRKCKQELPLESFCKDKNRKDNLNPTCKNCYTVYSKKWYKENKSVIDDLNNKTKSKIPPGVYMVKNLINGYCYVGRSIKPNRRRISHFSTYTKKSTANSNSRPALVEAMEQYGKSCFVFGMLEYCNKEELKAKEQYYINLYKPEYNEY